jgi:creatinine amidohydrolase
MRWEDLTAPHFAQAVKDVEGVCVLPVGVMEKHGEHLPLGTDHFRGRDLAVEAAKLEPAIIFPDYYFGSAHESKHQPGSIALPPQMLFDLLEEVCGEIARNGLRKIIIVSSHGGNGYLLPHFARSMLYKRKDFVVYLPNKGTIRPYGSDEWKAMKEEGLDGHAGEAETSEILHICPGTAKMDDFGGDGSSRPRIQPLTSMFTGFHWYTEFPDHYCGDGRKGTAEKGRFICERGAAGLADQFYGQVEKPLETPRNL